MYQPSIRAEVITRRTYNRPTENGEFETWEQTVDRVIGHQRWLWERARNKPLAAKHLEELEALRALMLDRRALPSGRTLWLGGTEVSKRRESSQFNCSFGRIESVHDVVDAYWLLLQGCGVGFEPVVGTLNGFSRPVELEIIRSSKTDPEHKGVEGNVETFTETTISGKPRRDWYIKVGDSAEAWAKLPGKLLANKLLCNKLTIDFSEIRPAGARLKNYGWISSGDELLAQAMSALVTLLNHRAGLLLTRIDILDLLNHLGATLSSRRSAEICVMPFGAPEWNEFAVAKKDYWIHNPQRGQSNNSLLFYHKPTKQQLTDLFGMMVAAGGSEPGFINAKAALERAPWFKGCNPCAEILLGNKSFCNLVEIDLGKFNGNYEGLCEAVRIIGRANYRQTCVNLDDGVLQRSWHELNEFLRLTGIGLTGIARWEDADNSGKIHGLRNIAKLAVHGMADELQLPRSQAVTTIKPSGTLGKIMDTTEGLHWPLGRYIFNNVKFSRHDPLVALCMDAGYRVFDDVNDPSAVLVTFPVAWDNVEFDEVKRDGRVLHINQQSAIQQLERYKHWVEHWVDHNASVTISYDPSEVPAIVEWIYDNWDSYIGVSFLFRADPSKTAEDLGFPYLPQEVVTKEVYDEYVSVLRPLAVVASSETIDDGGCSTGACPIR